MNLGTVFFSYLPRTDVNKLIEKSNLNFKFIMDIFLSELRIKPDSLCYKTNILSTKQSGKRKGLMRDRDEIFFHLSSGGVVVKMLVVWPSDACFESQQ